MAAEMLAVVVVTEVVTAAMLVVGVALPLMVVANVQIMQSVILFGLKRLNGNPPSTWLLPSYYQAFAPTTHRLV